MFVACTKRIAGRGAEIRAALRAHGTERAAPTAAPDRLVDRAVGATLAGGQVIAR